MKKKNMWRLFQTIIVLTTALSILLVPPSPVKAGTTIIVTTTTDEFGTGAKCSLREAIYAANNDRAFGGCLAGSGTDTIQLEEGVYVLSRNTRNENENASGDLDVRQSVLIQGAGTEVTLVTALDPYEDRIFHVKPPDGSTGKIYVTFANFSIAGGNYSASPGGAGILNERGNLTLDQMVVEANTVGRSVVGGGLSNLTGSVVTIRRSIFQGNTAGYGGAIYNSGSANISNSLIYGNSGLASGGGIDNNIKNTRESAVITNSTIAANTSTSETDGGAGIAVTGKMTIINSTIADNIGEGIRINTNGVLTIANTIIARHPQKPNCVLNGGALISNGYNLVDQVNVNDPAQCHFNGDGEILNQDPMISATLVTDGGSTPFYAFDPDTIDSNLAIDAIPLDNPYCPAIDQRYHGRPADGNEVGTIGCDIGSYEEKGILLQFFVPYVRK